MTSLSRACFAVSLLLCQHTPVSAGALSPSLSLSLSPSPSASFRVGVRTAPVTQAFPWHPEALAGLCHAGAPPRVWVKRKKRK